MNSSIYAFFKPKPLIHKKGGRIAHDFLCGSQHCKSKLGYVRRYTDSKDSKSTSNLRRHAERCWGKPTVALARGVEVEKVRVGLRDLKIRQDGSILAFFDRAKGGAITYSHRQLTKEETK